MRRLVLVIAFGVLLVAASPVQATPPSDVVIHIDTVFPPDGGPAYGAFTASGGAICSAGSTVDLFVHAAGFQSGLGVQLLAVKQFTCADGSGTFLLLLRVHVQFEPLSNTFSWSVLSGTGAYENLHGAGTGFGVYVPTGVLDTFTGGMHID